MRTWVYDDCPPRRLGDPVLDQGGELAKHHFRRLLAWAILAFAALSASGVEPKRVLFLHSYGRGLSAFGDFAAALRTQLAEQFKEPIEFHEAGIEPLRFVGGESDEPLINYLEALFAEHPADLVVPFGAPAVRFALRNRARLFPSAPLLFAAVEHRHLDSLTLGTNWTAVAADFDFHHAISSAVQVWPATTNIVVVIGKTAIETFWKGEMNRELKPFANHIAFTWLDDLSLDGMRQVVGKLPPRSLILYFSLFADGAGVPYEHQVGLRSIRQVAKAPIIGLFGSELGNGIAGGPLLSVQQQVAETARVAIRILNGESPDTIRVAPLGAGKPAYDYWELKRLGISESQLPAESQVYFRPDSWGDALPQIVGISAFCLIEAALIVGLIRELRRRRRTERSLLESQEQLAMASEAGGTGLWSMRIDTGEIWVTPKMRQLLQFGPEEELSFEKFLQAVHSEDRPLILQATQEAFDTGTEMRIEHRVALRDGSIRWISGRGRTEGDGQGKRNRITGASVDITERVQAEEALRASEERLKLAAEAARLGIWNWDILRDRISVTGPIAARFLNSMPPQENGYARFMKTIHPDDRAAVAQALARAKNGHGEFETVHRAIFADGTTHWIAARGRADFDDQHKPIRLHGVSLDITTLKEAEERAQESERRFSLMANAAPVFIWASGTDKKCIFLNKPWLEFKGRKMAQELGDGWAEGIHPDDLAGCMKVYTDSFDARRPFSMEYRIRRHDGQYRWLLDHGVPRYDPERNFLGYIGSCVDVTERKQAETEAQRARQELAHLNRVSTLGELAGSLAHELNQPLTAILSNAQAAQHVMGDGPADLGVLRSILTDIVQEDRRAGEVIARMRGMLKNGEAKMMPLDISQIVGEVLGLLHSELILRSISAETVFALARPVAFGDRIQLQQVLINLIMNACDSMHENPPDKRKVTIETQLLNDGHLEVAVSDLGPGFAPEFLKLERFRTSKPHGLGLGLAICRSIITAHGGTMAISNQPEGGARVVVTLPANRKEQH
ncbi:MAG: hypothetical protein C5B50_06770 [Verrucomicrobia bacterium]|nr:MAG: hypothetical protein C5B50_06770 [Verrucomicrobiota bacterium]